MTATLVKPRSRRVARIALALLAAVVAAGCITSRTVETTVRPVPGHGLPDGEAFYWVEGVSAGGFIIDPAEFLTGEAAVAAATEDGVIAPGEDLPNDFYIRNSDESTSLVTSAPDASYSMLLFDTAGSISPTAVDYDQLVAILQGTGTDAYGVYEGTFPADVILEDGVIVQIGQVYLP